MELGSGGANASGGGYVSLKATKLVLDGQILANGNSGGNYEAGSGGGILIQVGEFTRTVEGGLIHAIGGSATTSTYYRYRPRGGGGGRIAIYYETSDISPEDLAFAYGGHSVYHGGVGTVYVSKLGSLPLLKLDNSNRTNGPQTPLWFG